MLCFEKKILTFFILYLSPPIFYPSFQNPSLHGWLCRSCISHITCCKSHVCEHGLCDSGLKSTKIRSPGVRGGVSGIAMTKSNRNVIGWSVMAIIVITIPYSYSFSMINFYILTDLLTITTNFLQIIGIQNINGQEGKYMVFL